jgi:hypothetical protein
VNPKTFALVTVIALLCGINGLSQTPDGFDPPKLNFSHRSPSGGPFGFVRGMTKEQIIEKVGKENVTKIEQDALGGCTMLLQTAPKPYSAFSGYAVDVSATEGLLNVMAIGGDIDTSEDGTELKRDYRSVQDQLQSTYGFPTTEDDSVKTGSLWQEPRDFMIGMIKKDRHLKTVWGSIGQPANSSVQLIVLSANAKNTSTGYITLSYSFVGWIEYYDKLKANEGSAL